MTAPPLVGAFCGPDGVTFTTWVPTANTVSVVLEDAQRSVALTPLSGGYHSVTVSDLGQGARYRYSIDGGAALPDPATRSQPDGVHGPSEVIDLSTHVWCDSDYQPRPLHQLVISEIHIGALTEAGTFDAAVQALDRLVDVGISAIEIMPVAQFPGVRNWGYDGVFPFAAQNSYGGARGLQRLVDACHQRGLAVILDVVYNHLGPEGNVFGAYGPYFTDRYATPWGPAVNLDGPHSDDVRSYFVQNACYWLEEFRIDGLRLDAVHEFVDRTAVPFLHDLSQAVHQLGLRSGRPAFLIAESADNDPRTITTLEDGGLGLQAQWSDDFHHALHSVLTGESFGYYVDYGTVDQLATAVGRDFIYDGSYSTFRQRRHGAPVGSLPTDRLVHYAQNHDQIGNRADSARLATLVPFERLRMAAAVLLLSPGVPLLFMGEEYGEMAPFPYFVDHSDPDLLEAVRRGRQQEFPASEPSGPRFDPADPIAMAIARPDASLRTRGDHAALLALHTRLIELRRGIPAWQGTDRSDVESSVSGPLLTVLRGQGKHSAMACFNLSDTSVKLALPERAVGPWRRLISSEELQFGRLGPGHPDVAAAGTTLSLAPWGFVAYESNPEETS